jgi:uncharacterized protein
VTLGAPAAGVGPAAGPAAPTGCSAGGLVLLVLGGVGFLLLARRHPVLAMMMLASMGRRGGFGRGGFGGGGGIGGFGGGGFGGGGAGRGY